MNIFAVLSEIDYADLRVRCGEQSDDVGRVAADDVSLPTNRKPGHAGVDHIRRTRLPQQRPGLMSVCLGEGDDFAAAKQSP